ncbi:MAG: diguanylate cyclase [Planctomycetota bacterium]|nr:MAG: diguanylate cyclase [Planctomycetota bacterium]
MLSFLLRRLGSGVLVLGVVLLALVAMLALSPIDPSSMFINPDFPAKIQDQIRANMGLDQGVWVFCFNWLVGVCKGDLGYSLVQSVPVSQLLGEALPNTMLLSICSMVVIFTLGSLIGIFQAVRQYTKTDVAITLTTLLIYSAPSFWLAMMLQLGALYLIDGWPVFGMSGPDMIFREAEIAAAAAEATASIGFFEGTGDLMQHLLLPVLALGIPSAAGIARYMRSSMLEVIRQDYVRTAQSKGLSSRKVLFKHALRNAMIPIITLLGLYLPFLISGAVLVEYVFSWPGMGRLIVESVKSYDYPVIMANAIMLTGMVILGNLIADLLYSIVDPRISHG